MSREDQEAVSHGEFYSIATDPASRLTTVVMRGYWEEDIARRYCKDLQPLLERCRTDFGSLRLFTDCSELSFPSDEVADLARRAVILGPKDRYAVVTDSALAKMGIKRRMADENPGGTWEVFDSSAEAHRWIEAE